MAKPKTRAKEPTAAEKLMTLQAIAQQRVQQGAPPSPQVQVALRSFGQQAPTPDEIQRVANDLVMSGNAAAAVEFETYATAMAAPVNARRDAAQRKYDSGSAPSPAAEMALKTFSEPPTVEQIATIGQYLRRTEGPDVAQEFETYAASMVAEKQQAELQAAAQRQAAAELPPDAMPDQATSQYQGGLSDGARTMRAMAVVDPFMLGSSAADSGERVGTGDPFAGSVDADSATEVLNVAADKMKRGARGVGDNLTRAMAPAAAMAKPQGKQPATAESDLVQKAKDFLSSLGGFSKGTRREQQRDLNRERDLLNEAKNVR